MSLWDKAFEVALGRNTSEIPVVLLVYSLVLKSYGPVKEYEYYQNTKLQLEAKIAFQRRFPEILNIGIGTYPEYGELVGPIPTAFGARLVWPDDTPPYISEYPIKNPEDVDRLVEAGVPDSHAGIASQFLERLAYFQKWIPAELREKYGYLDGVVYPGLCVEGAALAMGYDNFLLWMRLHPDVLHKWLRLASDWYLKYCQAIEDIIGKCKILWIPDHTASMVSREHFKEFIHPYLNKIFNSYKSSFRIWHNEGKVEHMIDEIDRIDAEVWHFGAFDNPIQCRKTHFCLQGNLHPPLFAKYAAKDIEAKCSELVEQIGIGRFWLSTGGGMAPNTPFRNIDAMVNSAKKLSKSHIRP